MQYPFPFDRAWPIDDAVRLACLLEATAPKAGNVHPGAAFHDTHFAHFAAGSLAIGSSFRNIAQEQLGQLVLNAVRAMRETVGRNTHLGTILLLGPLAKAAALPCDSGGIPKRVRTVLAQLTEDDSRCVYEAIRVASPGGLGRRDSDDVASTPPSNLITAMSQVADVDAVARQYQNGFADVLNVLQPWLGEELQLVADPLHAIGRLQLRWLAREPDGLIVRKVGRGIAEQVQQLAQAALAEPPTFDPLGGGWLKLDGFLRADSNRRNPGTTADLIAAALFVQLLGGNDSALDTAEDGDEEVP